MKVYDILDQRDYEGFEILVLEEESSYIKKSNEVYWYDELMYTWTDSVEYFNECKYINFLVKERKR